MSMSKAERDHMADHAYASTTSLMSILTSGWLLGWAKARPLDSNLLLSMTLTAYAFTPGESPEVSRTAVSGNEQLGC